MHLKVKVTTLGYFSSIFPDCPPVGGGDGDMSNHSIKGTMLEISAYTFQGRTLTVVCLSGTRGFACRTSRLSEVLA